MSTEFYRESMKTTHDLLFALNQAPLWHNGSSFITVRVAAQESTGKSICIAERS